MQWTNSERGYGWLTIALHWIAAIGVVFMFAFGLQAEWLDEAGDEAGHRAFMAAHISLGITLFVFFLARIVQHYVQKQPAPVSQSALLNRVAWVTHNALLLAILLLIVSGPLMIWSNARAIQVWDWFALPSPFAERNRGLHELGEVMHAIGRYAIWVLVPLHVLAALKHLIFDRDGVFSRIFIAKGG
ncbi:MAG: cytochrome b/b6 domain-containing protein [Hyphomonadaceae bacterium]|nr:cytochrome b/b6 domain-containing protein [Hyphomonadaceae bacterium]